MTKEKDAFLKLKDKIETEARVIHETIEPLQKKLLDLGTQMGNARDAYFNEAFSEVTFEELSSNIPLLRELSELSWSDGRGNMQAHDLWGAWLKSFNPYFSQTRRPHPVNPSENHYDTFSVYIHEAIGPVATAADVIALADILKQVANVEVLTVGPIMGKGEDVDLEIDYKNKEEVIVRDANNSFAPKELDVPFLEALKLVDGMGKTYDDPFSDFD